MTGEAPKVLLHFLRDTLHVPYPVAAWLAAVGDTFWSIATTPLGMLVAAVFLVIGFYRFGTVYVAVFAGLAALLLVEWRCEEWERYSDQLQYYYIIQIMAASLALCLSASFIGRKLRPKYL